MLNCILYDYGLLFSILFPESHSFGEDCIWIIIIFEEGEKKCVSIQCIKICTLPHKFIVRFTLFEFLFPSSTWPRFLLTCYVHKETIEWVWAEQKECKCERTKYVITKDFWIIRSLLEVGFLRTRGRKSLQIHTRSLCTSTTQQTKKNEEKQGGKVRL